MPTKKIKCSNCGIVEMNATIKKDLENKKKSIVSGTCPNCSKSLSRIDVDMSKKV